MWLAFSLILSIVLLSGRLFVHNEMVLAKNDSEKEKVSKQLLVVAWIVTVCAFGILISGIIVKSLGNNFKPVGYTLLATSIVFMIQSETLKLKESKVKSSNDRDNRRFPAMIARPVYR